MSRTVRTAEKLKGGGGAVDTKNETESDAEKQRRIAEQLKIERIKKAFFTPGSDRETSFGSLALEHDVQRYLGALQQWRAAENGISQEMRARGQNNGPMERAFEHTNSTFVARADVVIRCMLNEHVNANSKNWPLASEMTPEQAIETLIAKVYEPTLTGIMRGGQVAAHAR